MAIFSKEFKVIKKEEIEEPQDFPFGHATSVRRQETSSGDVVVKQINKKGPLPFNVNEQSAKKLMWMAGQQNGKKIADEIRKKNNPAYFVPRTFISHSKVREQFASGQLWRDVIDTLSPEEKKWAYKALAEFINDMSELRPVRAADEGFGLSSSIRTSDDMAKALDGVDEQFLSAEDKRLFQDVYDYLSQIPENQIMVFGHNDLHGGNILIDTEKKQLSIIDFELSGYRTAFDTMYTFGLLRVPELWEYVNKLPRSTNPNLTWHFIPEHVQLHKFLVCRYYDIIGSEKHLRYHSAEIKRECMAMRLVLAQAKLKAKEISERQVMALVPVSEKNF
ncbi:MAG: phosphotransferase [Alphaproteobacteria bacterium]|nr:phosphotransferase [Alphaproteobacteria bacterium]